MNYQQGYPPKDPASGHSPRPDPGFYPQENPGYSPSMGQGYNAPGGPGISPPAGPGYNPSMGQGSGPYYQPSSFGSIRNTLGSNLKNRGVFQKDGQIHNLRGGFLGHQRPSGAPVQGRENMGMNFGGAEMPRQRELILQAAHEGIQGNGLATISPDHTFLLVANLPPPHTFIQGMEWNGHAVYACYLVDRKGRTGFMAGVMTPVGSGVYRAYFHSTVPLTSYEKVVISVENPQRLGQYPYGPIILKVKDAPGPVEFLRQMKGLAQNAGGKINGLFHRFVKPAPLNEEPLGGALEGELSSTMIPGVESLPGDSAVESLPEGLDGGGLLGKAPAAEKPTGIGSFAEGVPSGISGREGNAAGSAIPPIQPRNNYPPVNPQFPYGGNAN